MFNATFNNIPVISWQSVLLVEETGVPGENHRPDASHWQTLSHKYIVHLTIIEIDMGKQLFTVNRSYKTLKQVRAWHALQYILKCLCS